ncbi:MAG: radical SAM protein [Minisyncoccia bacterium]|jgi:uncharacterized protein
MYTHTAFKTIADGRYIVLIPTLDKLLEVSKDDFHNIPDLVTSEIPLPVSRWAELGDFQFLGTNFLLTDGCNLACGYCYEWGGTRKNAEVMSNAIIDAAVEYVSEMALKLNAPKFYANMFGGEPTQAFDALRHAVSYMHKKSLETGIPNRVTITTNGVMEEWQSLWLSENMNGIHISFDGPPEIHNVQRSRSFDGVFSTAKNIFGRCPEKVSFRITISSFSIAKLEEIVEFFGKNFPGVNISLEPVFSIGRGKMERFGMPSHKEFFDRFLKSLPIAKRYGCKLKTSVLNIGARSRQFCGVAGNNFMVTPKGEVTVCNRMVFSKESAESKFTYGHFDNEKKVFLFDRDKHEWLKKLTLASIAGCDDCFASSNCRGDCAANKAVIDPDNFDKLRSYRCKEIQEFIGRVMLYIIDHGDASVAWRE